MISILDAIQYQKADRQILQKKRDQWDSTIHIPPWKHPTTWLNQECWEDEIVYKDRIDRLLIQRGTQKEEPKKEETPRNPVTKEQLQEMKERKKRLFKN